MLTFFTLSFWIYFLYFWGVVFLAFFIPGHLLIKGWRLNIFQKLVLATIIGMVLWGWQGFIFGFLGLRWLTFIYIIIVLIFWLKINKFKMPLLKLPKINFLLTFLIVIGTLLQLATIFFMGVLYKDGIYFCCALPDSLYHLALTNQIVKQFPPIEPGASEIVVQNYHYFSNLIAADLIRVFKLPLISTYYQYLVLLFSLLYGLSAVVFSQIVKMDRKYTYWLVFFLYFSGDLTFLLLFFLGKGLNFSLPFLQNAAWLWISPPRVVASVIFFGGISLLSVWFEKRGPFLALLTSIILSSLIGVKIYVGLFVLGGLTVLSLYYFLKRDYTMLLMPLLTLILSLVIYLPVNGKSGGLIFTGLWRFENFIVSPVFNLSYLELARQIYLTHQNWLRLIQYTFMYIFIYFFFVFGTIMAGVFQTKWSLSLFNKQLNIFLISGIGICIILGSFFIQRIGGANSSQFLITVDIIASIYTALAISYWIGRVKYLKLKMAIILLIVILTVPRVLYTGFFTVQSLKDRRGLFIGNNELQALNYLKDKTDKGSIVLVDNIDRGHWSNSFSFYISFLSDRQLFVDGNGITQDHAVFVKDKIKDATNIFSNSDAQIVQATLRKNNIDYIYTLADTQIASTKSTEFLPVVFKNDAVKILKVLVQ